MNLTPGQVERHTGKYSHTSVRCERHLYQNELVERRLSSSQLVKHLQPFTYLVLRSSRSAEESFGRIKLLNESVETFQVGPHGERHLEMRRHTTVALKGQKGEPLSDTWIEKRLFFFKKKWKKMH